MTEIACTECGTFFAQKQKTHKYCSKKCKFAKNIRINGHKWYATRRKRYATEPEFRDACVKRSQKTRKLNPEHCRAINAKSRAHPKRRQRAVEKSRAWHAENKAYANPRRKMRVQKQRQVYPWQLLIKSAQQRSIKQRIPFDLTYQWAETRWTGKCELTDLPFAIGKQKHRSIFSPSIDKIVPELGYTQTNCRFVLWAINLFKYNDSDENMLFIAKALITHARRD